MHIYVYIYIYVFVCLCVCVCVYVYTCMVYASACSHIASVSYAVGMINVRLHSHNSRIEYGFTQFASSLYEPLIGVLKASVWPVSTGIIHTVAHQYLD